MSNYPSNSGQPSGNPLPYPDRQRPAQPPQQQYGYAPTGVTPSPTAGTGGGGLPYPDRPAKYSDYQQQSSSQPTYQQDSAPYRPPQQQEAPKVKPVAAEQKTSTAPWPTPPSAFTFDVAPPKPPKVASYSENVGGSQAHHTSAGAYAMGNVAAALPTTSSPPPPPPPPPPPVAPYQAQYQGSVHDQTPRPPPAPNTGQQIIPPYMDPQNQFATPPPPPSASPVYQGGQSGSIGVAPAVTAAAMGAGAAHSYSTPQSPTTATASPLSQPYTQTTSPAPTSGPYQQTQFDQKTKPYSSPPTTQGAPYGSPSATSPPTPAVQGQSPPQHDATTSPNAQQTGYMSGPPPVPGVTPASSFPPPPQTYRPSQFTGAVGVPPHPGQIHSSGSVIIDGKEHPVPAFTHTIQTPSQCDPALRDVYFGPYLRFTNVDLQRNLWLGSILLILPSDLPPPRLEFHQSGDFSHLQSAVPQCIYSYDNYSFFRYDLVMPIFPHEQKWTYAITTQGTQIWEFTIAGQQQQWRFIAWSCNDFSSSVKQEERDKLGFGTLWKDVMDRYSKEGAFHAQLGGGDQIYADRMWKEIPFLIEWLSIKGKEQRQHWPWKKEHEEIMRHTYFYYYTLAFSRPNFRDALAKIPHLFQIDDHDIFDGFGSYPHYLQHSQVFHGIGKIAFEFYLIFQHHTTQQWLYQHPDPNDLITATGTGWSFVKYFGPSTVILGLDTRAERDKHRIMSQESYNAAFSRLRQVPQTVVHCVVMLAVPIVYPRLEAVEKALTGVAVAKKGVNGAFNLLGKAVTTITPKGSATQETNSAFGNVKKAFGKSGLMSSVVSKFGEVDLLDDLLDHWTHANHDKERTMVIRTLQEIAFNRRIRITVVSGDVHCCGVGYLYDPASPQDHKLMYQIITSAIVNVPPPAMVIKLLHNNDKLFVPPMNSAQSTKLQSDTKEEMMELFARDVDGKDLGTLRKLLPRRNYSICKGGDAGSEIWEICVERGRGSETVKYGPIVIPRLQ